MWKYFRWKMASSSISYLGPAFLVCVGYMDPGKWATALEGGSRFGLELVWVLVASSFFAAVLQCLSSRLGLATGRNLAQVCHEEYPGALCFLLWLQCEVSIVILDLTMVLGIAIGLNVLLGLSMVPCILLTAADALLFLFSLPHLGMHRTEIFTASVMGVVLLCFVLDALYTNAASSAVLFGMLPRLKGESLYTAATIMGANIMPSNFYLHSALVQGEKKTENSLTQNLPHYNLIDIAIAFSVALLINIAVLSSAAAAFHNSGHVVITLQDAQELMEQILSNSVAPAAFGLALFCVGQLSTWTGTVAGQVALEGFVGASVPLPLHRLLIKGAATLSAIFLVWSFGSEGTYQVLIFSQVILALQLPFAVIPLIKVTSSQAVMGYHKNSRLLEVISWSCVALMVFMDIWLVFDMLFGESEEFVGSGIWNFIRDLVSSSAKWGETIRVLFFIIIVGVTVLSTCLLMWMVSTPLKADSTKSLKSIYPVECMPRVLEGVDSKTNKPMQDEDHTSLTYDLVSKPACDDDVDISNFDSLQMERRPDNFDASISEKQRPCEKAEAELMLESVASLPVPENSTPLAEYLEEDLELPQSQTTMSLDNLSFVDSLSSLNSSSLVGSPLVGLPPESMLGSSCTTSNAHIAKPHMDGEVGALKEAEGEADVELLDKDDYDIDGWENLEQDDVVPDSLSCIGGSANSLSFEEPESGKSFSARSDTSEGSCGGSGSGSLSRLSGLGRAARRQYAALLDEFWGKVFDLHGQPISQTNMKWQGGVAAVKIAQTDRIHHQGSAVKETLDRDLTWCSPKPSKRSWQKGNSSDRAGQIDAYLQASYHGAGSASSRFGHSHFEDVAKHSSLSYDASERRYSSLRLPSQHDDFDHQPATIHGYKSASYAGRSGNFASGLEVRASPSDMQHYDGLRSSRGGDPVQSFAAGSTYKLPTTMGSGNMQIDKKLYSKSVRSLISTGHADESLGRSFLSTGHADESLGRSFLSTGHAHESLGRSLGNSFTTDRVSTQTERRLGLSEGSPYVTSPWDSFAGRESATWDPLVYRATGELDMSHHNMRMSQRDGNSLNSTLGQPPIGRGGYRVHGGSKNEPLKFQTERAPLSFDEISPSQLHKDGFSIQSSSQAENHSLWSTQPFEQLFGSPNSPSGVRRATDHRGSHTRPVRTPQTASSGTTQTVSSGIDWEVQVLNTLRTCLRKLLRLDGSDWLFRMDSGSDEDLIGIVAARERVLLDAETSEPHFLYSNSDQFWTATGQRSLGAISKGGNDLISSNMGTSGVPHCGEGCVWGIELLVSFGVWCIHRILELSLMESRPELWGKYTYVLNRLQGILEPAFSKPRSIPSSCICVQNEPSDSPGRCLSRQGSFRDSGNVDLLSGSLLNDFSASSFQGYPQSWPWGRNTSTCKGKGASASIFLEIIKEVETAIGARKGRTGTAAGDVAFPKGKENLASVLKRYKRRLGNKSSGASTAGIGNIGNRRAPVLTPALFLQHLYFFLF